MLSKTGKEVFADSSAKECRLLFNAYEIECLFGFVFFFQWLLKKNVNLVVLGTFDINTKHIETH